MSKSLIAAGIGIIVLGIVALASVFVVNERDQAIVLQFGAFKRQEKTPGLHFMLPWQSVRYFDKRVLDFDADVGEIPTKDQKQTQVDTYVRYRITDPLRFFQTARSVENFEAKRDDAVLNSTVRSTVRNVFTQYDLSALLSEQRSTVIHQAILQRVKDAIEKKDDPEKSFGVEIIDVRIKRIDLPRQNREAVEARMETERRQEATLIRADGERKAQTVRAEADREVRVITARATQRAQILRGEGEGTAQATYNKAFGQDVEFFEFWQCMQSVKDGLGPSTGTSTTRYVGIPSSEILFQLCKSPITSSPAAATPMPPRATPAPAAPAAPAPAAPAPPTNN